MRFFSDHEVKDQQHKGSAIIRNKIKKHSCLFVEISVISDHKQVIIQFSLKIKEQAF